MLGPQLCDCELLLKRDVGRWTPVTGGESDAHVFRHSDGARYAKCVALEQQELLQRERDRVSWLSASAIPGPEVLDWRVNSRCVCLVMSTVPGVPADTVPADVLRRAWSSVSRSVRDLHALPTAACPFSRDLSQMWVVAEDVVARDLVNPAFLPVEHQQTAPTVLLAELALQRDRRISQEGIDTVVCHGDLCLPNIILDPATMEVSGFTDLGRLGRADRYVDVSLLLASARESWRDEHEAADADQAFARDYGIELDTERQRFYLHLDPLTWATG